MGRRPLSNTDPVPVKPGYSSAWFDRFDRTVCLAYWIGDQRHVDEIPFEWFFFMRNEDIKRVRGRRFDRQVNDLRKCADGKFTRVYSDWNDYDGRLQLIDFLREQGIEPLEADVDPVTRYITENPVRFAPPRVLFYDLETDPRRGWVTDDRGRQRPHPDNRILSFASRSAVDGRRVFESMECLSDEVGDPRSDMANEAEGRVMRALLSEFARHDLFVAWNGDNFDEPHLRERAKRLGFKPHWWTANFMDHMALFKHPYYGFGRDGEGSGVKISFSLESIGQTVLGHGKVEGAPGVKMFDVWAERRDLLEEYNLRDVDLMAELEERTRYIETHTVLCNICNRFPSSRTVDSSNYLGDGLMLKWGKENQFRWRTKQHVSGVGDKDGKLKGAHVMEPVPGLHRGVHCTDVGSLYPNLVKSFNISPETLTEIPEEVAAGAPIEDTYAMAANGAYFDNTEQGAIPAIVSITLAQRQQFKDRFKALAAEGKEGTREHKLAMDQSNSWKVASNMLVGLLGAPYSRIYSPACFEAVTYSGAEVLELIASEGSACGLKPVYGDTDSGFLVSTPEQAEEFLGVFAEAVDGWVAGRGGNPGFIRLGVDAHYDRIFWTAKKKYAGIKGTGKWDVKGLELIRTDGALFAREMQREVIKHLLEAPNPTPDAVEEILRAWADRLHKADFEVEEIALTKAIRKALDEYKSKTPPPQVRVAKALMDAGHEVYIGMRVSYVMMGKQDGKAFVMPVEQFDPEQFDPVHFWKSAAYPPTRRIVEAVFPDDLARWKALLGYTPNEPQHSFLTPTGKVKRGQHAKG